MLLKGEVNILRPQIREWGFHVSLDQSGQCVLGGEKFGISPSAIHSANI